ncbi:DJ-1/PfpI family protein [Sphingomonas elodea]|uniref:DJ-1/PfpI family protein n=1 Tax=Sphingomonas elodea TaxID=179878 RepID=UPI0002631680|nr:DJ-1/PfpI family protein [Sphingomonas elodea]
MTRILLPVYDQVDMLDVAGPMEMFGWAGITVDLVAEQAGMVRFRDAFPFAVDKSFADVAGQRYDALWVPGGEPAILRRLLSDPPRTYCDFLAAQAARCDWVCSVCEGALLLAGAGLLDGYRATTHWAFRNCLKAYPAVTVVPGHPRFVQDRNRLTGGGISAGLDEALELIRLLLGQAAAEEVQRTTQYYPRPPVRARLPKAPPCPLPPATGTPG